MVKSGVSLAWLKGLAAVICCAALVCDTAEARRWGSSGSSGSSGSWGSSGSSGGSSGSSGSRGRRWGSSGSSGSSGSYGSYGGGYYGSSGSSGGYVTSYYGSGGSSGSTGWYASGGTSYGSSGGSSGGYYHGDVIHDHGHDAIHHPGHGIPGDTIPGDMIPGGGVQPLPEGELRGPADDDSAQILAPGFPTSAVDKTVRLRMSVPEQAEVYLNGQKMTSVGSVRNFVSPKLSTAGPYVYQIRIELTQDGQELVTEHQQKVTTGRQYELTFAQQDGALVLVPADQDAKLASR